MSSEPSSAIVVGGKRRLTLRSRLVLLIVACLLLLAGVATTTALVFRHNAQKAAASRRLAEQLKQNAGKGGTVSVAQAIQRQMNAVSTDPERAAVWMAKGNAARDSGNASDEINDYLAAIKLDPNQQGPLAMALGDAYRLKGDKQNAIDYYRKAIEYYQSAAVAKMPQSEQQLYAGMEKQAQTNISALQAH